MCLCPQDGWTALHLAAQAGNVDVVRLLTEAQALVNIQSEVLSCLMIDVHLISINKVCNSNSDDVMNVSIQ